MRKCFLRTSRLSVLPSIVFLALISLTAGRAAAQGAVGVLNSVAGPPLPAGTPVAVVAEEFTDTNTRLQQVIERALVARGYTVQPQAPFVLEFDTEMSAQTDPEPQSFQDRGMEAVEQDMEQTPPWSGGGQEGMAQPEMFDSNLGSIPLGGGGGGSANRSNYSLSFTLGRDGSPAIWQGSVTAVLPNGDPFEIAETMVPVLVDHIGQTARGKQVPIE